jgi:hypothetical protein
LCTFTGDPFAAEPTNRPSYYFVKTARQTANGLPMQQTQQTNQRDTVFQKA